MRCPYCRCVLDERAEECSGCRMNYPRALAFMGALPQIQPGIEDAAALLDARSMRKLRSRVEALESRFPQTRFHVVVRNFSAEHSMELHAFWIFNAGFMADESHKGGENRDLLMLLDPEAMTIAMIAGYGLEPLVSQQSLERILQGVDHFLRRRQWLAAFLRILEETDALFVASAQLAEQALGVRTEYDPERFDGTY